MPTYAEVEQLPLFHRQEILSEHIDALGHMNIRWYMALYDDATWRFFASFGMDQDYFLSNQAGGFALKHFVRYLAEVHAGETLAVRTRVLGRSEKRIHFMHFLVNESTRTLASTLEAMGSHADMRVRRTSPFPPHLAGRYDELVAAHAGLDWEPPLCGIIKP